MAGHTRGIPFLTLVGRIGLFFVKSAIPETNASDSRFYAIVVRILVSLKWGHIGPRK